MKIFPSITDLFNALHTSGVDATLNGTDITFLHDSGGNEITSLSESLTSLSGSYTNDWFELDVNIAQRIIQE